jgi:hypothetical protein
VPQRHLLRPRRLKRLGRSGLQADCAVHIGADVQADRGSRTSVSYNATYRSQRRERLTSQSLRGQVVEATQNIVEWSRRLPGTV